MITTSEKLKDFCTRVLAAAGLTKEEALCLSDCMVEADLRGVGSHGVSRLYYYASRVKSKIINSGSEPEILSEHGAVMTVDGKNGVGSKVGRWVMDRCIEGAKRQGAFFATVNNGNHFGIAAYYTEYAARHDMIGIAVCNADKSVAPTGGAAPMLGTNPLSIAVPAGKHPPFILDMATSVVARGKIVLADKEGRKIPSDWAVDKNGAPTTNPKDAMAGNLLPIGGPKGYGISLFIDILVSCLGGALDSRRVNHFWDDFEKPQGIGFFMGAFDISKFVDIDLFKQRMDRTIDEFHACPPAPGYKEVMVAGEPEFRNKQRQLKEGITLSEAVYNDLKKLALEYKVEESLS